MDIEVSGPVSVNATTNTQISRSEPEVLAQHLETSLNKLNVPRLTKHRTICIGLFHTSVQ